MVLTMIYYMYKEESFLGRTAIKVGHNKVALALTVVDAMCWGALLVFGIHFFTCGG